MIMYRIHFPLVLLASNSRASTHIANDTCAESGSGSWFRLILLQRFVWQITRQEEEEAEETEAEAAFDTFHIHTQLPTWQCCARLAYPWHATQRPCCP